MSEVVVVTGDGCLSALGRDVPETMRNLYAGFSEPSVLARPYPTASPPAPVFLVQDALDTEADAGFSRTTRLALRAVEEALARSWGGPPAVPPERIGVCFGTTTGCTFNDEPFYREYRAGGRPAPEPIRRFLANDVSRAIAERLGARGPVATIVNACASGTDALGRGADWIRSGSCDVVIAGGADELSSFPYLGFISLKNSSRERCRPFDRGRKGLNLGEGAAALVLESEERARRRGAAILGRLAGYASASDAFHPTAPHPQGRGLRRAIRLALLEAGLSFDDIGFVNAHGTGTTENDRIEGTALATLFPSRPPVFSTKGYTGHTTGAAGAVEALLTVRNLLDGRVPKSGGFETPDPDCGIVPTTATTDVRAKAAMSNSLAFGGTNSVLVFRRGA